MSGRNAGRLVAVFIAAVWVVTLVAYSVARPRLTMGKKLITAAQAGDLAQTRALLDKGAVVNVRDGDGHTALWLASFYDHADIAELLLRHGSDPNARGYEGMLPLMAAARNGNPDVVRVLIAHGANVNAEEVNGDTALSMAEQEKHADVAAILRKAGERR